MWWPLLKIHDFLYAERPRNPRCTCCQQRYLQGEQLLIEIRERVFLCARCIDRCAVMVQDERTRRLKASTPAETQSAPPDSP